MALIQCPECNQSISDKAAKCPRCGYPIQEHLNAVIDVKTGEPNDDSKVVETVLDTPMTPVKKKHPRVIIIAILIACVAVIGVVFGMKLLTPTLLIEDISISKWRLTDSTEYSDYYEGIVTSEQTAPFVAVIGRYTEDDATPEFVYISDGEGVMETVEGDDEDPSTIYKPIGYMTGTLIEISDLNFQYEDSDYYDYTYSEFTSCDVLIEIDTNTAKTGILVFDIVNETNHETQRNCSVIVNAGKSEYSYYATLPYKARGIDVTIEPRFFCESTSVLEEDWVVEKEYTAEKYEGEYSNSYTGDQVISFDDYDDGFLLYTKELLDGGSKSNRNIINSCSTYLCKGECTFATYDYVDEDEKIFMPTYEFNVIGYLTWMPLELEVISNE